MNDSEHRADCDARPVDDSDTVETSVIIAFTHDELLKLYGIVHRYVPLSREPELATLRQKIQAAVDTL